MHKFFLTVTATAGLLGTIPAFADSVLVTSLQGEVTLEAAGIGKAPLEPFVRLRDGDRLGLGNGGKVSLVYVGKARLEAWQGAGTIIVGESESRAAGGKPQVQVRSIPPEAARQMNKTPSTAPDGRVGMMRMRGIPPQDSVSRLETEYRQLRDQLSADDMLPEVMLLAGLFDLRQYDRIEVELTRISASYQGNPALPALQSHYTKALAQARAPGK